MTSRPFTVSLLVAAALLAADPPKRKGMVFIPGGEFLRGRSHALPDDGLKWVPELVRDDRPARAITIGPFYLDQYEVTNEQFRRFVQTTRHRAPYNWPKGQLPAGREKLPVAGIDWNDASAYCKWDGKRLPTEAEWEHAARGLAQGKIYPWGDQAASKKAACYDTLKGPCPVGQFPPNYFQLFDMAGNVWEWTADWYAREYYAAAPAINPTGPASGKYRVIRGGSWADVSKYLTCAYRSWARPLERSPNIGVRCAANFK